MKTVEDVQTMPTSRLVAIWEAVMGKPPRQRSRMERFYPTIILRELEARQERGQHLGPIRNPTLKKRLARHRKTLS